MQKDPIINDSNQQITIIQQGLASCTGAVITSLLMTPLDVVKTRLQAQQKNLPKCFLYCNGLMDHICSCDPTAPHKEWFLRPTHFNGTLDAFVKISRNEGVTSLWSGLSPTLVLALPSTIIYFVTYEQLKLNLREQYNRRMNTEDQKLQPFWIPMLSGAVARTFSVTIVNPLELIRTKMQSKKTSYREVKTAVTTLVKTGGIGGLWMGYLPTLLRDVPFSAMYWLGYETVKKQFSPNTNLHLVNFISGATAGCIAATCTVPFDVVKTHQQVELGEKTIYTGIQSSSNATYRLLINGFTDSPKQPSNVTQIIRNIYRTSGFKGLFTGLTPRLFKVAPACAIMISSFEYGKTFFHRLAYDTVFTLENEETVVRVHR